MLSYSKRDNVVDGAREHADPQDEFKGGRNEAGGGERNQPRGPLLRVRVLRYVSCAWRCDVVLNNHPARLQCAHRARPVCAPLLLLFHWLFLCRFVDVMGTTFVGSVIVPYSLALKKDASYASLLLVVRFACNFLANIYMPIIGDRCGRTIVAIISLAGSAVAYSLQACAVVFGFPSNSGWYLLLVGKAVEGLFAGTGPAMMAYTMELSVPRMGLLRIRYAILIAMMFGEFLC